MRPSLKIGKQRTSIIVNVYVISNGLEHWRVARKPITIVFRLIAQLTQNQFCRITLDVDMFTIGMFS